MVAMNTLDGLIVTTRAEASAPLAELATVYGWPTLWAASARALLQELSLQIPACVLFWLDDVDSVAATAKLIEWLREEMPSRFAWRSPATLKPARRQCCGLPAHTPYCQSRANLARPSRKHWPRSYGLPRDRAPPSTTLPFCRSRQTTASRRSNSRRT